jgi:hypothetical protein
VIISASYKTDIPAFYSEWFFNRLRAGYCVVSNPYSGKPVRVDLRRENVDGFVFWTRNFGPMMPRLDELRDFGAPFVVQFTITGYPRELEPFVMPADKAVAQVRELAALLGSKAVVWRYDTILLTSVTPLDFHRRNFGDLAASLAGAVDEVVISFVQMYRKTVRNISRAAQKHGFAWSEQPDEANLSLTRDLAAIAALNGVQLTVCSQNQYVVAGAQPARCVDARRLSGIGSCNVTAPVQGNRPDCLCSRSRDIGEYDTCPQGCVYCYAVANQTLARQRHSQHDPMREGLRSGY